MGKNAIERGNRDSWTPTPRRVIAADAAVNAPSGSGGGRGAGAEFKSLLRAPEMRDPRGFILPADQSDFPSATAFINALIKAGVTVHRATAPFSVGGKNYPANSWVVKSAQAFRPHVLDMFEPQDHPDDIPYPGGRPNRPYDNAGWTLAYQMGVRFDRLLEGFDGPFEKVNGLQTPPAGKVAATAGPLVLSHATNNAFIAVNRLLAAGREVMWLQEGDGAFYVPSAPRAEIQKLATDLGISFEAAPQNVAAPKMIKLRKLRIALADQYGGSMPSGWTRWLLEQFEFPFEVVFPKALDAGNLASRYDVIIFPSGVGPSLPTEGGGRGSSSAGASSGSIPPEYNAMLGSYSATETAPQLQKFLEGGGTILAVGRSAMNLAQLMRLPVGNHLVERSSDGRTQPLPVEKYYVPGSILRLTVDPSAPLAHGISNPVDAFFDNSPVFKLDPDATLKGVRPVAWFNTATPLRSGWAFGQGYLEGGVQIVEATVGKGTLFLFAPEITFRAQPAGTFKFLFNGIYLAAR